MQRQANRAPVYEDARFVMYIATTIEELKILEEH